MMRFLLLLTFAAICYSSSLIQKPMRKVLLKPGSTLIFQQDTRSDMVFLSMSLGVPVTMTDRKFRPEAIGLLLNYLKNQDPRLKNGFNTGEDFPILHNIFHSSGNLRTMINFLKQDFNSLVPEYLHSMFFPRWDEKVFREVLGKEIERVKAEKPGGFELLNKEFHPLIYPGTTYKQREFPEVADLSLLSMQDLQAAHQAVFHPLNISFTLIGDLELRPVVAVLHEALSDLQVREPVITKTRGVSGINEQRFFSPRRESSVGTLAFLGPQYSHEDSLAFMALEKLLWQGFSGQLAKEEGSRPGLTRLNVSAKPFGTEFRLEISFEVSNEKPQVFARRLFEILELFRTHPVSNAELLRIKTEMKEAYAAHIAGGIAGSIILAGHALADFPYTLPVEFNRYIDSLTPVEMQKICQKYLDFDNYHFYTLEPEANRDLKELRTYTHELYGMKIVLKEDDSFGNAVGLSWSYPLAGSDENIALPYVAAFGVGRVKSPVPEIQKKLESLHLPVFGFPAGERLLVFGQISESIWKENFLKILPHILLERKMDETDLQYSIDAFEQFRKQREGYADTGLFYKHFLPEKSLFWCHSDSEKPEKNVTMNDFQGYIDGLLQTSELTLVLIGNFNASQVYAGLEESFTSYLKSNPKQKLSESKSEDTLKSVDGRVLAGNTQRKKVIEIEGDRFYFQTGSIFKFSEMSVRRLAAFMVYLSLFNDILHKEKRFPEANIKIDFTTNGGLLPVLIKIDGPKKQREEIISYAKNLENRVFAGVENIESALAVFRKIILLSDNYTRLDVGTKSLSTNLYIGMGLSDSYRDELMDYIEKTELSDIKEAYGFFLEKKDYELLFK